MKRILLLFLLLSCMALSPERDLAEFLHTRSAEPLESTIWEHKTGDGYDKYLLFRGGEMSLFYGLVENDELQRWSEFYSAPYYYDGGALITYLSYPEWGEMVRTNEVKIVKSISICLHRKQKLFRTDGNRGRLMRLHLNISMFLRVSQDFMSPTETIRTEDR